MLLTYALNAEGKLVNIDTVENGLACKCVCPGCKEVLVAKNDGNKREHHFAHKSNKDCPSGNETAIHLLAKEIIKEEGLVPIINKGQWQFEKADSIEVEKSLDGIKPDLYAIVDGIPEAIEILVTHAVDKTKYDKIQNLSLRTIEINLSAVEKIDKQVIKETIYDIKSLGFIYDSEIMNGYLEQKKQYLINNGKAKSLSSGIVQQCPLSCNIYNGRIVKLRNVRSTLCKKCLVSFVDGDKVHCGGYIDGQIPTWFIQSNLNENRFMHIEETNTKLNEFKGIIKTNSL